jgi:MFS family permease
MVTLDATVVNVALPRIDTGLHFSAGSLSWVLNAYTLAFGDLLLLGGRLGDAYGQKRVMLAGLAVLVTRTARDDRERHQVLALFNSVSVSGGSAGLVVGGLVTQLISWRWTLFSIWSLFTPAAALVVGGVRPGEASAASGLLQRTQQLGGAIGLAIVASVYAAGASPHAFLPGLRPAAPAQD